MADNYQNQGYQPNQGGYQPHSGVSGNQGYQPQYPQQPYQQGYQQGYQQPQQPYYQPQVVVAQTPNNGLGVAGFVCSICAIVFCWVPILDVILWLLGLIFSFIGMFKAPRGLAIAGFILALLPVIALICFGSALLAMLGVAATL